MRLKLFLTLLVTATVTMAAATELIPTTNPRWGVYDMGKSHIITGIDLPSDVRSLCVVEAANKENFLDAVPIAVVKGEKQAQVTVERSFRYVRAKSMYATVGEGLKIYGYEGENADAPLMQITNIPTVVINTEEGYDPFDKETDLVCNVFIISNDGNDVLEAAATVRERGNASRGFPKKPWRIKFDKKQNVLDAPCKAKKWTLINNYGDKTLMRNRLAFDIAEKMGMSYVPYCTFVDVVMNGDYKGTYQLCDQIEVREGRVNITEMTPDDNEGEALTGGYLFEVDAYAGGEGERYISTDHYYLPISLKSPDSEEATEEQWDYLTDYFNAAEREISACDTDPVTGYRRLFDTRSFIQHMLTNEMAGNTDAYWSTYMYKDRNSPVIYTGPVWDFDLGFNNDNRTYPVPEKSGDGFLWNCGLASSANGMLYFAQRVLLKDPTTWAEIQEVWANARDNEGMTAKWLIGQLDSYAKLIDASQKLNFTRWPILWEYVHQNPRAAGSYEGELQYVRDYIKEQMKHLDKVMDFVPKNEEPDDPEDPEDGISTITTDAQTPSYFTLQGIRIAEPQRGDVVIRSVGGKSQKIVF